MSLAQKIFDATSLKKSISKDIFTALMNKAKLEIIDSETFYYSSKYHKYELYFGMTPDRQIDIQTFGMFLGTNWIELKPTPSQLRQMKILLALVEIEVDLDQEEGYIDEYFDNGVDRKNFY